MERGSSDPRKDHEDYARMQELFSKCELMDMIVLLVYIVKSIFCSLNE